MRGLQVFTDILSSPIKILILTTYPIVCFAHLYGSLGRRLHLSLRPEELQIPENVSLEFPYTHVWGTNS